MGGWGGHCVRVAGGDGEMGRINKNNLLPPVPPAFCLLPPASCLLPPAFCLLTPDSCLLRANRFYHDRNLGRGREV
ncbi:MAG: hypothetical protein EWV84_01010 [Microcystis sp. M_QC_C_20170808_M3Col]|uniref:hypothetical protein n=1 Tax=unclassified Microcystis TaxID=2643300 RepID=UPI00118EE22D|nr:MAG: hypothetical protein EWV84_01010 [Microcystis sp. M_QC_C_20170808_M3Col]